MHTSIKLMYIYLYYCSTMRCNTQLITDTDWTNCFEIEKKAYGAHEKRIIIISKEESNPRRFPPKCGHHFFRLINTTQEALILILNSTEKIVLNFHNLSIVD